MGNNTSKCYKGNYNGHLILKCWINVSLSIFDKYWLIRGLMFCGHLFNRVLLVMCEVQSWQYNKRTWTFFKVYLVNREDAAGMLLLFRKRRRTHNEWTSYCIWPRCISWNWPGVGRKPQSPSLPSSMFLTQSLSASCFSITTTPTKPAGLHICLPSHSSSSLC